MAKKISRIIHSLNRTPRCSKILQAIEKGTDLPYVLADAAAVAEHTDVYVFGGVSEDADGFIVPMKEPGLIYHGCQFASGDIICGIGVTL